MLLWASIWLLKKYYSIYVSVTKGRPCGNIVTIGIFDHCASYALYINQSVA